MHYKYTDPTPEEKLQNALKPPVTENEVIDKGLKLLAAIIFVLLVVNGWQYYFGTDTINENYLVTIPQCIITEPVRQERTEGKQPHYFYRFKFRGHNLDGRFSSTYYEDSPSSSILATISEGDTVTVQIDKAELGFFNNQYSEGKIDLFNVAIKDHFLVDHSDRNAQINRSNKKDFHVFLIAFAGIMLLILLKKGWKNRFGF